MTQRRKRPLRGLFDEEFRHDAISSLGDPLERLNRTISWELFRPLLEEALRAEAKGPGGRPAYDSVLMFKILILQQLYHLSDGQMQFQINDRLSFMRFLGLTLADAIPDEKTIWLYRERLTEAGIIHDLFGTFTKELQQRGLLLKEGSIIDASIVEAPVQRNSRKENSHIQDGTIPEEWSPAKRRQKDTDARWTRKHERSSFGYKNHVKVSQKRKMITAFEVTPANIHDSQVLPTLIDAEDAGQALYADSAYDGEKNREIVRAYGIKNRIQKKAGRHVRLTAKDKRRNHRIAKIRGRIEHVFGSMVMQMGSASIRSIGEVRAHTIIGLRNIVYNMLRMEYYVRSGTI